MGGRVTGLSAAAIAACASRRGAGADGYGGRYRTRTRGGRRGPRHGRRAISVTRVGGSGGAASTANGVTRRPARPPSISAGPTTVSLVAPVRRRRGRAWSTDTALCRDCGTHFRATGGTRAWASSGGRCKHGAGARLRHATRSLCGVAGLCSRYFATAATVTPTSTATVGPAAPPTVAPPAASSGSYGRWSSGPTAGALAPRLHDMGRAGPGYAAASAGPIARYGRPTPGTRRRYSAGAAPAAAATATATVVRPRSGCGGTTPRATAAVTRVAPGRRPSPGFQERGHCGPCAAPAIQVYGRTAARAPARTLRRRERPITNNNSTQ